MNENSSFDEILVKDPLIKFSVYTHIQIKQLEEVSNEILQLFDSQKSIYAYGKFWLWVLGAFAVIRTMYQARSCFDIKTQKDLCSLKNQLSKIRVPFEKQEYEWKKHKPINSEASIAGLGDNQNDMIFIINDSSISARNLIRSFKSTTAQITQEKILRDHRKADCYVN